MDLYLIVKLLHIVSSTILFGAGMSTAFFMLMSQFSNSLEAKLWAARTTVLADYVLTAPAVIIQPLTGIFLIYHGGYDWDSPWLLWAYGLYILIGLCWLPVVFIQIKLKKILQHSLDNKIELPDIYNKLYRIWFILGWPAFISIIAIFFLMVVKPS